MDGVRFAQPSYGLCWNSDISHASMLLTRRSVGGPQLTGLLPNLLDSVLRPQASEVYIVSSAGRYHYAYNSWGSTGVRHIGRSDVLT